MYFDSLGDPTGPLFTSYSTPQALNQLASEAGMGTGYHRFSVMLGRMNDALALEVWPESHWPGFALREADVFKTYMAWWCM